MDRPVELVPLVCVKCTTPVPANPDEVAWVCAQCGQGLYLDEMEGLRPAEIHFAAAGAASQRPGLPFWVADGRVSLQRNTYQGSSEKEATAYWSTPRRFFVPAWSCSLEEMLKTGIELLNQPYPLQDGSPFPFQPVTLGLSDVPAAAEFIVVAIEAGRKDKLRSLNVNLQLQLPSLWILPA